MKALLILLSAPFPIDADTVTSAAPEILPCPCSEPRDWLGRLTDPDLSRLPTEEVAADELRFQEGRLAWLQGQRGWYPCREDQITLEWLIADCEWRQSVWEAIYNARHCDRLGNRTTLSVDIGGQQSRNTLLDSMGWLERFRELSPEDWRNGTVPRPIP